MLGYGKKTLKDSLNEVLKNVSSGISIKSPLIGGILLIALFSGAALNFSAASFTVTDDFPFWDTYPQDNPPDASDTADDHVPYSSVLFYSVDEPGSIYLRDWNYSPVEDYFDFGKISNEITVKESGNGEVCVTGAKPDEKGAVYVPAEICDEKGNIYKVKKIKPARDDGQLGENIETLLWHKDTEFNYDDITKLREVYYLGTYPAD